MDLDLTESLAPKSDQMDAVDLATSGPRTFTITNVTKGSDEQPFNFHLAEFPRVWRPSKGMRRVITAAWGGKTSAYAGKRLTLFCNPDVKYAGEKVGGIEISAMSDLPGGKRLSTPKIISKGKSVIFTVEPLTDSRPVPETEPTADQVAACTDPAELRVMWHTSGPERRTQITARVAELHEFDGPNIGSAAS